MNDQTDDADYIECEQFKLEDGGSFFYLVDKKNGTHHILNIEHEQPRKAVLAEARKMVAAIQAHKADVEARAEKYRAQQRRDER